MKSPITLAQLKENIRIAFNDIKYPGDDKIAIKKWYLEDESLGGYVGLKRDDVTVDFINNGHRICTGFMTNEAFLYYLPSFLIICAESAYKTDVFSERILEKLIPPLTNNCENTHLKDEFFLFFEMLSKEQREVICDFLIYYENTYKNGMGETAMNYFWEKYYQEK